MVGECPKCGREYHVADKSVGMMGTCPCGYRFRIGESEKQAAPPTLDTVEIASPDSNPQIHGVSKSQFLLIGGVIFVVLAFGVGMALGLMIHPPDQHEYEKGYEAGSLAGQKIGYGEGRSAGYSAGIQAGKKAGEQSGQEKAESKFSSDFAAYEKAIADFQAHIKQMEEEHATSIARTRNDRYQQGLDTATQEQQQLCESEKSRMRATLLEDKSKAVDDAYARGVTDGEASGGFSDGREVGIETGLERGKREGLKECDSRIDTARAAAIKEGRAMGHEEGYSDGRRAGYKSGRNKGYGEGYEKGKTDGYTLGYADGKRAAG